MMKTNFQTFAKNSYIKDMILGTLCSIISPNLLILTIFLLTTCSSDQEEWKKADRLIPMKEYTEDDTREWEEYKEEHIPVVRNSVTRGQPAILIELPKLISSHGHYIESFGLLDDQGNQIVSKSIERSNNPINYAFFQMENFSNHKRLKAFIKCNLHDTWVKEFRLEDLD